MTCSDVAGWSNGQNDDCDSYKTKGYCANGAFVAGKEWTGGAAYKFPERNCCACGKPDASVCFSSECPSEDLVDEAAMKIAGWSFKDFSSLKLGGQGKCSASMWHGFAGGDAAGVASKVLRVSGTATLEYGNCWNAGKTNVYLNGKLIDSIGPLTAVKKVVFKCNSGDVLELKDEEGNAVIQMKKLTICGAM